MSKEERIEKERERLAALFADLDENRQQAAAGLISSAAFLRVSLEDLEAEINANGCIDEYTNGANQSGYKVAANVQAYTSLNAKYQSTMQKLLKIVPPAPKKPREKSAEEIAVEEKAKREEEEKLERLQKEHEREQALLQALGEAFKGETPSVNEYREYKEQWLREHPEY